MPSDVSFLYVEDDALSRQVMQMLLTRSMGYQNVAIFEDSADFLTRLQALSQKPDVIFLDIHMLPYDGFHLLKLIREQADYDDTRVIAVTASVMNEEIEMLKTAGFDGGIAKPLDFAVFPQVLAQILDGDEVWHVT